MHACIHTSTQVRILDSEFVLYSDTQVMAAEKTTQGDEARHLAQSSDKTITIAIEHIPHGEDPDSPLSDRRKFLALGQATRNEGAENLRL